ncbi:MAG: glycosyltransferase [Candidatus Omnitrophota bacterium]|nr:MAG: glycosyltransferase [Candidatus Omnitrophota bacterium]
MKISIITPDLSRNCLGRAYLLAKVLQRKYDVEIIGLLSDEKIWQPIANDRSISYKSIKLKGRFKAYWQLKEISKKITGDIIYVHKPLFINLGVGLVKKIFDKKPLVIDIDDWEMGFVKDSLNNLSFLRRLKFLIRSTLFLYKIDSYWNVLFGEKLVRCVDDITVSNHFLQRKFSATIIRHGKDTDVFAPEKFDNGFYRSRYGIEESKKVVMFFGTPMVHKGIEDLIKAVALIKNKDTVFIFVGADGGEYCQKLIKEAEKILPNNFRKFEQQPFGKIPEFLTMADVIVIPQRRNTATVGQIPAKLFDAMAMSKPIVATDVSDVHEILDECGWVIEPGQPVLLARTIQQVLGNPGEAQRKGKKAREKCVKMYSWAMMEETLTRIFGKYE